MNLTAARTAMADLYAAIAAPAAEGSVSAGNLDAETLLETVEQAQQVINIAGGIQTHAIAHLAAHDEVRDDEDEAGWAWKRHSLGFTAEDTASLVASRLGVSVPVAQGRVEDAVHQVSVTPRLVDVMGAGDLDLFRAHLITREVTPCSDEVAREIVDRLIEHYRKTGRWGETAGPLASRTRRLVARLAPEVAAATKARAVHDRALTRRPISEAADLWNGLVPVEQSLVMWQAIDHLARKLKQADPSLTLDQARLDAMQQLILGQADVTIHLHATHSDSAGGRGCDSRGTADAAADASTSAAAEDSAATDRATSSAGLAERAVRGIVELGGLNRPGTTTVDLDGLAHHVKLVRSTSLACHPDTGALLSGAVPKSLAPCDLTAPPPDAIEARYRPSPALQRLIRLRDGHCRFPGCVTPARSCDLDHVIAWPAGPTGPLNLMLLCRRHHRVKQRPGWSVRLDPDGIVHWTDPSGRVFRTSPVDHLDRVHHADRTDRTDETNRFHHADAASHSVLPDATSPGSARHRRLTRQQLDTLLASGAPTLDTLAELSLARLLHLADAGAYPESHVKIDWSTPPGDRPIAYSLGAQPEPPARDEPPPF